MARSKLQRRRSNRVIAGVCGGLADAFGLSPWIVRLAFVLFGIFGVGEVIYVLLWLVIPKAPQD